MGTRYYSLLTSAFSLFLLFYLLATQFSTCCAHSPPTQAALDLLAAVQRARYDDVQYKAIDAETFAKLREAHFISSVFTSKLGKSEGERLPNMVQRVQQREAATGAFSKAAMAAAGGGTGAEAGEGEGLGAGSPGTTPGAATVATIEEADDDEA